MPLSFRRVALSAAGACTMLGCGPEASGDPVSESSSTGDGSGSEESTTEAADDLSWLIGRYVASCLPFDAVPLVHECKSDTFHELEFSADGIMKSTRVMCGDRWEIAELGHFSLGSAVGTASVQPAPGFSEIYVVGFVQSATVYRTPDCFVLELEADSGASTTRHKFVRGEFDYAAQPEGCVVEAFATAVPECPDGS